MSLRVRRKALEAEPLQFQNKMLMENRDGKVMGLNKFFGLHQGPSRPQALGRVNYCLIGLPAMAPFSFSQVSYMVPCYPMIDCSRGVLMVFIKEVISSHRAADLVVHISIVTDPLPPNLLCFSITGDNPVA